MAKRLTSKTVAPPLGGEVGPQRSEGPGEGAFAEFAGRPPHPPLRVDLSPKGEVKEAPASNKT